MDLWGLYVFLAGLAATILTFMWWSGRRDKRRQHEIAAARPFDTLETFVASFAPELQPIARAMYARFQEFTDTGYLPFRNSDPVLKTLGMDPDDLDEALQSVANQFGCRKPTKEDDSKFRDRETFEDFVEFIHFLKTPESQPEHSKVN